MLAIFIVALVVPGLLQARTVKAGDAAALVTDRASVGGLTADAKALDLNTVEGVVDPR